MKHTPQHTSIQPRNIHLQHAPVNIPASSKSRGEGHSDLISRHATVTLVLTLIPGPGPWQASCGQSPDSAPQESKTPLWCPSVKGLGFRVPQAPKARRCAAVKTRQKLSDCNDSSFRAAAPVLGGSWDLVWL